MPEWGGGAWVCSADPTATHIYRRRTMGISEARLAQEAAAFVPIQRAADELMRRIDELPDDVQHGPIDLMLQVASLQIQVIALYSR